VVQGGVEVVRCVPQGQPPRNRTVSTSSMITAKP
jgi:hypothetical protein